MVSAAERAHWAQQDARLSKKCEVSPYIFPRKRGTIIKIIAIMSCQATAHVSLLVVLDSKSYRGSGRKFIMARISECKVPVIGFHLFHSLGFVIYMLTPGS